MIVSGGVVTMQIGVVALVGVGLVDMVAQVVAMVFTTILTAIMIHIFTTPPLTNHSTYHSPLPLSPILHPSPLCYSYIHHYPPTFPTQQLILIVSLIYPPVSSRKLISLPEGLRCMSRSMTTLGVSGVMSRVLLNVLKGGWIVR